MLHFLFSEISTVSWVFYFYKLTLGFNHQDLPRFLSQREDGIEVHPKWLHIWEIAPSTAYVDALHLQVHGFTLYNNKSHQRQTLTRTIVFSFNVLTILLVGMGPMRAHAYETWVYTVYGKTSEYLLKISEYLLKTSEYFDLLFQVKYTLLFRLRVSAVSANQTANEKLWL